MPDKPAGMGEEEKWEAIMRSIRKAAHILRMDLTERDMPDYLNWPVATDMNKRLWAMVYAKAEIERELGLRYDGIQEGLGMQFTDPQTGSTTYGNTLGEVKNKLAKMRAAFAEAKVGNPIDKSKIRGELVRLKTDIEEYQHDVGITGKGRTLSPTNLLLQHEEIYRDNVERAMEDMAECNLKGVFLDLEVLDNSAVYLMRQNHDAGSRIATIEHLLKEAIIEIATEKCQCKFHKEET